MKKIAIYMMRFILSIIYFFMKLKKTRDNRIVFLSRQENSLSLDFRLLRDELASREDGIDIKAVCSRITGDEKGGMLRFAKDMLRSMSLLATSRVAVLDAYWPAVSLLNHKKSLTVIQMWHAMGKIKKSGHQTLGKESGRNETVARAMRMHEGYDYIIAGGRAWNRFYCESFSVSEDKLVNCGLPRTDYLIATEEKNRQRFFAAYPELADKMIIVYAPTFRRGIDLNWQELALEVSGIDGAALLVMPHPNQNISLTEEMTGRGIYMPADFRSVETLPVADYLITDYSAIAVEAAVLNVKTLYFVPDYEEYTEKNGMNIDLFDEMPGLVFREAGPIREIIEGNKYRDSALASYREKFLPEQLGSSTEKIASLVLKCMRK